MPAFSSCPEIGYQKIMVLEIPLHGQLTTFAELLWVLFSGDANWLSSLIRCIISKASRSSLINRFLSFLPIFLLLPGQLQELEPEVHGLAGLH
jgi:hypothetical protein